jgi:hypothetical protein
MSTPEDATFPAELLQRYEPLEVLGSGAMGIVFAARDKELDRPVAVKKMRGLPSKGLRTRFRREASLLASLRHPAIVELYAFHELRGDLVLVMELLEGVSLEQVEDAKEATRALLDVAGALRELHTHDLVHRDVKPANVLRLQDGRGVLIDFGMVHDDRRTQLTVAGEVLGTLAYMDPDLLRGQSATPASDWYGWAASIYDVLAGRPPYTVDELLTYATKGGSLPELSPPRGDLPEGLWASLRRLLVPAGAEPGGPPAKLLRSLEDFAQGVAPRGPARTPPRPKRRGRGGPLAAGALGLAVLAGWFLQAPASSPPATAPTPGPSGEAAGPSPEAAALDEAWRRLARAHLDDLEAPFPPRYRSADSPLGHLEEVADVITDERYILGVRRLGAALRAWWSSLPVDRPLEGEELRRFERVVPGLLEHVLTDYRGLGDRVDLLAMDPGEVADRALASRRARNEYEEEIRGIFAELDFLAPPRGDAPLSYLGELIDLMRSEQVEELTRAIQQRGASGEVSTKVIAEGALRLGARLVRWGTDSCAPGAELLEQGLSLVEGEPELLEVLGVIVPLIQGNRVVAERCQNPVLEAERIVAALATLPPRYAAAVEPGHIFDLAEELQAHHHPVEARLLWWWGHKQAYLHPEGPELRARLNAAGPLDADPLALAKALPEDAPEDRWAELLVAILDAVDRDSLRADPDRLGQLTQALDARRRDQVREPPGVEALLLGTLYRLDHPLAPPRFDRLLLLDALAGDLPYGPLWRYAWGNERTEQGTEILQEHFAPEDLGAAILIRHRTSRAFRSPAGPCHLWSGRARGVQGLGPTAASPSLLEQFTWWKIPQRLEGIHECLTRCGHKGRCIQDPSQVRRWLVDYRPPLGPARRAELHEACSHSATLTIPRTPRLDATERDLLERYRSRCAEVGVVLPEP